MNRQHQCRRKLVHLDAVMCEEISNTADGSKCLREPMSASVRDCKMSCGLLPRPSHKSSKSCSQSFEIPGISEFSCDKVEQSDIDVELTDMGLDNNNDIVSDSVQPKCSVDFVSAKQYMNPTFNLLNYPAPQNDVVSPKKHGSMLVGKGTRRTCSKHATTTQKNSLDRYFKPVPSQSLSTERTADCSSTPENSPRKSVIMSPMAKVPGSDNIYCYSPESKTNPEAKRKSAMQTSHPSKKMASCVSRTDTISRKSVASGCMPSDLTASSALQQSSNIFSTEQYGLLGFSENTLLALDCDTDFEEEDKTDYFSQLPLEVVSNVLCRLPFSDLCLNVNRVCLTWKNIIDSDEVSYLWLLGCLYEGRSIN